MENFIFCTVHQKYSVKKAVLKKSNIHNSQDNTCVRVSFLINLQARRAATLLKRKSNTGIFQWKHAFLFYKQRFFFNSPSVLLNYFMNWASNVDCLIHISIIIMRHFLYLLYMCPCLGLGLFIFPFFSIFIMINRIISCIQTNLFFYVLFRVRPII